MNKNGFTLVELIAVIVILGLIGLITAPAVMNVIRESKEDVKDINVDTVLNAAYDLAQKDPSKILNGEKACVTELVNCGLLKEDIYKEIKGSSSAYFEVINCSGTEKNSACVEEPTSGKYFGSYLFLYKEDKGFSCDGEQKCRFKPNSNGNE